MKFSLRAAQRKNRAASNRGEGKIMQPRVIPMTEQMNRKVNVASAACGLSCAEFVRAAVQAALVTMAYRDRLLRTEFAWIDGELAEPSPVETVEMVSA